MRAVYLAGLALLLSAGPARAQFSSGSDGSYGPIDVPDFTTLPLPVPPNGIFNATTVTVGVCASLTFDRNALNTPIYLLATGDIVVGSPGCGNILVNGGGGTPNLGGVAGPGGFDGGAPGIAGGAPGAGHGPGAGKGGVADPLDAARAGSAAYGGPTLDPRPFGVAPTANDGVVYGSPLLVPLVGGSGGGGAPGQGGGGGGGAILLASSTQVVVNGSVNAQGGVGPAASGGSGGAIRIVAPRVAGSGVLAVDGSGLAGHGRVRIDLIDRTGFALTTYPSVSPLSVGSFMKVFLDPVPRLDITNVAGKPIAEGTSGPVVFVLPFNSPTSQPITVQARDFTGVVLIRVVLTPDSGDPTSYDDVIDMANGNPATVTVNATFPINVAVRIHAWTRTP
jgi:hypothetical protein